MCFSEIVENHSRPTGLFGLQPVIRQSLVRSHGTFDWTRTSDQPLRRRLHNPLCYEGMEAPPGLAPDGRCFADTRLDYFTIEATGLCMETSFGAPRGARTLDKDLEDPCVTATPVVLGIVYGTRTRNRHRERVVPCHLAKTTWLRGSGVAPLSAGYEPTDLLFVHPAWSRH